MELSFMLHFGMSWNFTFWFNVSVWVSLMIFDRHANLKYKYGNRHFWARGYFVDTVGKNKKQIQEYIKNQLTLDQIADQVSIKEFLDPFTGSVNQKA